MKVQTVSLQYFMSFFCMLKVHQQRWKLSGKVFASTDSWIFVSVFNSKQKFNEIHGTPSFTLRRLQNEFSDEFIFQCKGAFTSVVGNLFSTRGTLDNIFLISDTSQISFSDNPSNFELTHGTQVVYHCFISTIEKLNHRAESQISAKLSTFSICPHEQI